jgi:signal transduction histidine kinase
MSVLTKSGAVKSPSPGKQLKPAPAWHWRFFARSDDGQGHDYSQGRETEPPSWRRWPLVVAVAGLSTLLGTSWMTWRRRFRAKPNPAQSVPSVPAGFFDEFGTLVQELAHEIRNPLTAINARLYKLEKKFVEGTPEHRDLAIIENEIKRLDQMLENFRNLGWHGPLRTVPLLANTLVTEVCELMAAELAPRGVELCWQPFPELQLHADPQQFRQVMINLVKNAAEAVLQRRDASRRNGTIWVRMRRGRARFQERSADAIIVEVQDNGPGIPDEVKPRLFEPFFSTKEQGTGLGLPIAARILAQHGGSLEFESRCGHGATFRVLMPEEAAV